MVPGRGTPGHRRELADDGETLFDAELGAATVPVLVINNQYNTCMVSLPGDAPNVLSALTRSPRKELVTVTSRPNYERLAPVRRDVAAWLSWDRGHCGAAHLRLDESGWRALTTAFWNLHSSPFVFVIKAAGYDPPIRSRLLRAPASPPCRGSFLGAPGNELSP